MCSSHGGEPLFCSKIPSIPDDFAMYFVRCGGLRIYVRVGIILRSR